jgi:hypothetical protein
MVHSKIIVNRLYTKDMLPRGMELMYVLECDNCGSCTEVSTRALSEDEVLAISKSLNEFDNYKGDNVITVTYDNETSKIEVDE